MKSLLDSQMIVLYNYGMVLMKIRNGCCGCWWYPDKLMSLLAIFKKATYLCRNLPWRCKRNALVFATNCSLLISFCWSSLNKENLFWFFYRESLKLRNWSKNVKNCYFSNFKFGSGLAYSQILKNLLDILNLDLATSEKFVIRSC